MMVAFRRNLVGLIVRQNDDGSETTFQEGGDNDYWREIADDVASGAIVIAPYTPAEPAADPIMEGLLLVKDMKGLIDFGSNSALLEDAAVDAALVDLLILMRGG